MDPRTFPVLLGTSSEKKRLLDELGCPRRVPWALIEPHEAQAEYNHGQTLKRLSERGGLGPEEMAAVLTDQDLHYVMRVSLEDAVAIIVGQLEEKICGKCKRRRRTTSDPFCDECRGYTVAHDHYPWRDYIPRHKDGSRCEAMSPQACGQAHLARPQTLVAPTPEAVSEKALRFAQRNLPAAQRALPGADALTLMVLLADCYDAGRKYGGSDGQPE